MADELFLTLRHDGEWRGIHRIASTETTIGRTHASSLCLPNHVVSRQHAVIALSKAGFVVKDLGSRNGTLVNGQLVVEASLTVGSVVRIGPYSMKVFGDLVSAEADGDGADDSEGSTRRLPLTTATDQKRIALEQQLTPAQRRVYEHLLRGLSEKEIAAQLGISINTVHSHSCAIYKRFEVSSRAELISWCGGMMAE